MPAKSGSVPSPSFVEVSQFPIRLNLDTVREVRIVQVTTFRASGQIESGHNTRSRGGGKHNFSCPRNRAQSPRPRQIESGHCSRSGDCTRINIFMPAKSGSVPSPSFVEVSQFPVRLNPVTICEVGIVQGATFCAREIGLVPLALAGLNPGTIREVGTGENTTFCARGIRLVLPQKMKPRSTAPHRKSHRHSAGGFSDYSKSIFAYSGLSSASRGAALRGTSSRTCSLDGAGLSSKRFSLRSR